jgi:hypothetical protein
MDTLILISVVISLTSICAMVVIGGSSDNMRKMAAWLIAAAQAKDEIRRAKLGIETERRIRQQDLEDRLTPRRNEESLELALQEREHER